MKLEGDCVCVWDGGDCLPRLGPVMRTLVVVDILIDLSVEVESDWPLMEGLLDIGGLWVRVVEVI